MNFKKLYYRLLYHITQKKKYKKLYKENWGINNKLIIINENGVQKEFPPEYDIKLKWLDIHWMGNNNVVTIKMPTADLQKSEILITSDNNNVYIDKFLRGQFTFNLFNGNNNVKLGENISALGMTATLNSGSLTIGNNCMISVFVNVMSDGHSVIDNNTKELLNKDRSDIRIGDYVWLGFGVNLLKNAKIGNNCIVANSAVVTKPFEVNNVILAGIPAKIVKTGINWDRTAPVEYSINKIDFNN